MEFCPEEWIAGEWGIRCFLEDRDMRMGDSEGRQCFEQLDRRIPFYREKLKLEPQATLYLQYLTLSDQSLGDLAVRALVEALLSGNVHLWNIELYKNQLGDAGAQALATYIENSPAALGELRMSHNYVSEDGFMVLLAAVARSQQYPCKHPLQLKYEILDKNTAPNIKVKQGVKEEHDSEEESMAEAPARQPPGIALENLGTFRKFKAPLWLRLEHQNIPWEFARDIPSHKRLAKGRAFVAKTERRLLDICQETGILPPGPVPPGLKLLCMPEPKETSELSQPATNLKKQIPRVAKKDETDQTEQKWSYYGGDDYWNAESLPELQCMASKCKNLHHSTMCGPMVHLPYIWSQGTFISDSIPLVAGVKFRDAKWRSWTPSCLGDKVRERMPIKDAVPDVPQVQDVLKDEEHQGAKRSVEEITQHEDEKAASSSKNHGRDAKQIDMGPPGKKSKKLKERKSSASSPKPAKVGAFKHALSPSVGSVALNISSSEAASANSEVCLPLLSSQGEQAPKEEDEIVADAGEDVD
eukprot:gnl/MRDRNA2_/MRDRNA2_15213_c0_seq1.p1 gnl/MRDRNA2_/MRDRNA2_15213_c0~~gnl/MRDRNA2_/MRDRNA2_15213_c0_seq1.p1  ORF type:complete len:527 (-),score=98.46 gnl/MRDRNA2_/MRDRNA2_15213_c0_seq1:9-1589(-)